MLKDKQLLKTEISFSPRLELRLGPFLFGIGGKFSYWIQETKEQIMKDGKELRSNISASGKNSSSLEYHVGLNIPIKENFGIEGILGYNEEAGTSFGLRGTIKLGGSDKPKINNQKMINLKINNLN